MTARLGFDRQLGALLTLTFLFPVVLCLVAFPTPAIDLREHINWGVNFPLYTWKLPPLQDWLAGAVALTGIRDAWPYVLVAQLVNFAGLYYLVRIGREFIGAHVAVPIAIAFCGSIFSSVAVPDTALNADQIQMPLWLGVLYHGLRAARDGAWPHWIACGALAALGVLAKYFTILFLLAFALAVVATPSHRPLLRRPGPWIAAAIALAVLLLHLLPLLGREGSFDYAEQTLQPAAGLTRRVDWFGSVVGSVVLFGMPLLIALAILAFRRELRPAGMPRDGAARVILLTAALLYGITLLLTLLGMRFRVRYGGPMLPVGMLGLFCLVRVEAVRRFLHAMLIIWAVVAAGVAVLVLAVPRIYLRDPAPAAAAAIRADWDRRYACGPGYILGHLHAAHGIGLYFGRGAIGVSHGDFAHAQWVDHARLRRLGAVVVENAPGLVHGPFAAAFPAMTAETVLALPYRRTWQAAERIYAYRFVAPQGC